VTNYKEVFTDPELRSAFVHALVLLIFYAVIPLFIGLLLAGMFNGVTPFPAETSESEDAV